MIVATFFDKGLQVCRLSCLGHSAFYLWLFSALTSLRFINVILLLLYYIIDTNQMSTKVVFVHNLVEFRFCVFKLHVILCICTAA